ncbi:MAG TPA: hypothetical protein PLE74_01995 [Candidatus Cloacimonadota bacterium]|nr:hypothetical protein [Candidatus Cloacimonadota bacterium]HPT71038.1 hypothetical protein [Candidatus Cloacimonadota bacterium]
MKNMKLYSLLRMALLSIILLLPAYIAYALEDDLDIDSYKLPSNAVTLTSLQNNDEHYTVQGKDFTGVAFEKYPNNKALKKVVYIRDGLRNGPTYAWYSQGQKMMYADYKNGKLDGKFYGWYAYGAIMYNLVYRDGRLDSDQAFMDNDDRDNQRVDSQEGEGEAPTKEGE